MANENKRGRNQGMVSRENPDVASATSEEDEAPPVTAEELADGTPYDAGTGEVIDKNSTAMVQSGLDRNLAAVEAPTAVVKNAKGEFVRIRLVDRAIVPQDKSLIDLRAYARGLGYSENDIKTLTGGSIPFWPCIPGSVLSGVIESRRQQNSSLRYPPGHPLANQPIPMAGYVLRITHNPAVAATSDSLKDGAAVFMLPPGENIFIIERRLMEDWKDRIGRHVMIACVDRKPSKTNPMLSYWDFRTIEVPGPAPVGHDMGGPALGSGANANRQLAEGAR